MIRINKNESPIRALTNEEIAEIAVSTRFQEYTDDAIDRLTEAYAAFHGEDPALIAFANGSDEWIQKCKSLPISSFRNRTTRWAGCTLQLSFKKRQICWLTPAAI